MAGVENHELNWTTPFGEYESYMIDKPPLLAMVKPDKGNKKQAKGDRDTWFCKEYNSLDECQLQAPHMVVDVNGKERMASHICSKCWRTKKLRSNHLAVSVDCRNPA